MRKPLTSLEKRLAAYATAAGVALAVAPSADAQIVYTDIEPDLCVSFSSGTFDIDGDGVDDFSINHSSFGSYLTYGDFSPYASGNLFMADSATGNYAQALITSATISSLQTFGSGAFSALFGVGFGVGNWLGGNTAFVGMEFIADRAGAATTNYAWARVFVPADHMMVCVQDFAYETAPGVPIGGGVIPVELVSFDAQVNGSDVVLNWETSSETNNAGFEVQMMQGEDWNVLGFVEGNGTTTETQTYSFTANGIDVGTHSFRLKQIDFDGAFEYSPEVEATIEVVGTHQLSNAYPNPFNPQSQFNLAVARDQRVTAELYNVLGQRVATLFDGSVEANRTQVVQIEGADLASGVYVVRITGETFSDVLRVTLTK